jgi:hypothetical protein
MILSVIFKAYEHETLYFTLMEAYWLKVFVNMVMKTVLGHMGKEAIS